MTRFSLDSDLATEIAGQILKAKYDLIEEGKKPRVVIISEDMYDTLKEAWLGDISDLPWGDTLKSDLKAREDKFEVFLADGTIYGLWVVRVNSIEDFKVY